jgi:hypothetical protein
MDASSFYLYYSRRGAAVKKKERNWAFDATAVRGPALG